MSIANRFLILAFLLLGQLTIAFIGISSICTCGESMIPINLYVVLLTIDVLMFLWSCKMAKTIISRIKMCRVGGICVVAFCMCVDILSLFAISSIGLCFAVGSDPIDASGELEGVKLSEQTKLYWAEGHSVGNTDFRHGFEDKPSWWPDLTIPTLWND